MEHAQFDIGTEFEIATGQRWRCTDVGQRSIVAIELHPELEDVWFNGPPYPVPEVVFDEQDMAGAFQRQEDGIVAALLEADRRLHPGYPHRAIRAMTAARLSEDSCRYPRRRLLRIDRVDAAGEILHPYAAECTPHSWQILLYAPFSGVFSALSEQDFVRLPPALSRDFEARRSAM